VTNKTSPATTRIVGHQRNPASSNGLFSLSASVCNCDCTKTHATHPKTAPAIVSFVHILLSPSPLMSFLRIAELSPDLRNKIAARPVRRLCFSANSGPWSANDGM
jgi:hypothetical protein